MKLWRLAATLAALLLPGCALVPEAPPPSPCGVTPDGSLSVSEWQGAQRIDLGSGAVLWLIQGPEHMCLGVETRAAGLKYVDLFIQDGGGVTHNLHASMQVGERIVPNARWTDEQPPTMWGQTTGWTANAAPRQPDADASAPVGQQLGAFDGYEFVIARASMQRPWRMRLEIRDFDGHTRDIVWPAQSRRNDRSSWALFL